MHIKLLWKKMKELNMYTDLNISYHTTFPQTNISIKNLFLNLLTFNIQSLRNKIDDLTDFIEKSTIKFHIIVLTETHIKQNDVDLFNIPNYKASHCIRKKENLEE
jgi:hypothetical protein